MEELIMIIQAWKKVTVYLVVGLFLAGAVQVAVSISVQRTNDLIQSTGTRTSFDPFSEGWLYRKQITIDHTKVSGDLVNFPVLIHITDSDLPIRAQSNGNDILFMDGSGTAVQLHHEIEYYSSSSGELIAWVNIPSLSSTTDRIFYLYYGNKNAANQQNPEQTWDSNYVGVWHFGEQAGSTVADSTEYAITGTASSGAVVTTGFIGNARNFDGSTGSVDLGTSPLFGGMTAYSVEAWVNPSFISGETRIFDRGQSGYPNRVLFFQNYSWFRFQTNNNDNVQQPHALTVGSWYYLGSTFIGSGGEVALYVNGVKGPTVTSTQVGPTAGNIQTYIGATALQSGRKWHGMIDEVRFSKVARTSGWIATEYANQNAPLSFMSIGPEEPIPLKKTIMFGKITNLDTIGTYTVFNAVNLRCIQFSPFGFIPLQSGEFIVVSNQYRGFITPVRILAICDAHV